MYFSSGQISRSLKPGHLLNGIICMITDFLNTSGLCINSSNFISLHRQAQVAELVDASVSKTDGRESVPVRSRPRVQLKSLRIKFAGFLLKLRIWSYRIIFRKFTSFSVSMRQCPRGRSFFVKPANITLSSFMTS